MRKVDWRSLINSANFRQLDDCFCTTTCEADEERQSELAPSGGVRTHH